MISLYSLQKNKSYERRRYLISILREPDGYIPLELWDMPLVELERMHIELRCRRVNAGDTE